MLMKSQMIGYGPFSNTAKPFRNDNSESAEESQGITGTEPYGTVLLSTRSNDCISAMGFGKFYSGSINWKIKSESAVSEWLFEFQGDIDPLAVQTFNNKSAMGRRLQKGTV